MASAVIVDAGISIPDAAAIARAMKMRDVFNEGVIGYTILNSLIAESSSFATRRNR